MSALKLALLGTELSHSLSKPLHEELFPILHKKFGAGVSSCTYELIEIADELEFGEWIRSANANGFTGANVTYPYKSQAFDLSDSKSITATAITSANTLRFSPNGIESASTDGLGLLLSIRRKYPTFDMGRYHVVLIGAGAAARAAIYSLCTMWMPLSLTIVNRTVGTAEELAEFCISQAPGPTVRVMSTDAFMHLPPEERHRLIIQCTPMGQTNNPGNLLEGFSWHETDFAIDLIYNPKKTEFLTAASHGGAKTSNGIGMLIEQAALSQIFWLNGIVPDSSPLSQTEFDSLEYHLTQFLTL
ncbi:MAG: hypothetical protein WCH46_01070 [bacterium]